MSSRGFSLLISITLILLLGIFISNSLSVELYVNPESEVNLSFRPEDIQIADRTKILNEQTLNEILHVLPNGTYMFRSSTSQLKSLSDGDIIVIGGTDPALFTALRRITSININSDSGAVTICTEQAKLEEALQDAVFKVEITLSPDDVIHEHPPPLIAMKQGVLFTSFIRQFEDSDRFKLYIDTVIADDQIKASGRIEFDTSFIFKIKIAKFNLKEVSFFQNINEEAALKMTAADSILNFDEKEEIKKYKFRTFKIMIGYFPIYIKPTLYVYVGATGEMPAQFEYDAVQKASLTAGIKYSNGCWDIEKYYKTSYENNSFQKSDLDKSEQVKIKGFTGIQLELMFYGVAGPNAMVRGYLELDCVTFDDQCCTPYGGGLQVDVGVKVDALSRIIVDEQLLVIDERINLNEVIKDAYNPDQVDNDDNDIKLNIKRKEVAH